MKSFLESESLESCQIDIPSLLSLKAELDNSLVDYKSFKQFAGDNSICDANMLGYWRENARLRAKLAKMESELARTRNRRGPRDPRPQSSSKSSSSTPSPPNPQAF